MRRLALLVLSAVALAALPAQQRLTVPQIFGSTDFAGADLDPPHWMRDGRSVLEVRDDPRGGSVLVKVDLVTGATTVLADAATLTAADGQRLTVEDAVLSPDESKVLLFHSSVRVWRTNTRGVYHVYDLVARKLTPLVVDPGPRMLEVPPHPSFLGHGLAGGATDPALQMFATFSPNGTQVAFVRGNNLWVTDLTTGHSTALTSDGSDDIINGTTDWVYEEELGLRDAFRFSVDGSRIAYWRFDQSAVPAFPVVDEMLLYPTVSVLRYPKAGAPNSRVRIGVVSVTGGSTRWLDAGSDTGSYPMRMEWVDSDSLFITRLTRRQNRADLLMLSATTGVGRTMEIDRDSAYVGSGFTDVKGEGALWLRGKQEFLWESDRSGWRQVYLFRRDGSMVRQITTDGADVLDVLATDETRDMLYVAMAAPNATQRQVFRYSIHGGKRAQAGGVRLLGAPGTHRLDVGPTGQWAIDVHSTIGQPATMTLYEFPLMRLSRVVVDNAPLRGALAALGLRPPEFLRVPLPNGIELDGYRIAPADFDLTRKYPVLMYVYGGPAAPLVQDAWSGDRYLWHQMLAQHGYVVVVVDNRGAAWRGREFRKTTQLHLGVTESDDQIAVARWLGGRPWVDASRIGIWGWSYGGYLTTMSLARGGNVFRMGMAVAPVTDWRLYDSIYTERYMWTPQENEEGYRASSPQLLVGGMTARFLLVHGTGDDNVHPQNTLQLAERLIEAGKRFDLMLYPNRSHSISGGNATVHLFEKLTAFVLENL